MWSPLAILLMVVMVLIVMYRTTAVIVGTVRNVVIANQKFAMMAFVSSSVSAIVGYLRNGVVTIEIVLYGFLGCLIYILALLIKFNGK